MNLLRIYVGTESNELGFKILDEFNAIIGEHYGEHESYRDFFDKCEEAVEAFDCIELDTIWLDEVQDLLDTYSDDSVHPLLWGLMPDD